MDPKLEESSENSRGIETELDKISSLPEHLIDNILSHLSIKDAVGTSILSRGWRYKWATVPSLVFDEESFSVSNYQRQKLMTNKIVGIIDHVLQNQKGPLQKLELSHLDFLVVASDIERWIGFISGSVIKEFILEIWKGEHYKLPHCLFNWQNLTNLKLRDCSFKPPPTFKGFKNLTSLKLGKTTIDQDMFENLICSCPLLERLSFYTFFGYTDLNIDAPNLKHLYVQGDFHDIIFKNIFNLESFSIGFDEENYIHDDSKKDNSSSKLLTYFADLPHIQELQLFSHFLKYLACGSRNISSSLPKKCLDLNYLYIDININDMDEIEAALCLFRSSPNLQELVMHFRTPLRDTYTNLWGNYLSSSLFTHLREATILYIHFDSSNTNFIKFLLPNAPVLEKLTIKASTNAVDVELVNVLLQFSRSSPHVEIVYLG